MLMVRPDNVELRTKGVGTVHSRGVVKMGRTHYFPRGWGVGVEVDGYEAKVLVILLLMKRFVIVSWSEGQSNTNQPA